MVGLVIAFPGMVMHYKSQNPTVDPSKIEIQLPPFGQSGVPSGLNLPLPSFGGPGPNLPGLPPGLSPPSVSVPPAINIAPPPPAAAAPAPAPAEPPAQAAPSAAQPGDAAPIPAPPPLVDVTKPPVIDVPAQKSN